MDKKINPELLIRLGKIFAPIVLGFSILGIIGLTLQVSLQIRFWPLISWYSFPPLGKESIIPTGIALCIDPLSMALSIAYVDIVIALFLVWNYDLAKKIPLVGKFIIKVENIGKTSSNKYGWIKPLRFIGIVLFVMVPFQGSGGLVGFIVGRLIGMKPWNTFLAILIGAITGCLLIAYFADAILSVFIQNFMIGLLIIIILLVIGIMILIYKKTKKKNSAKK